MIKGEFDKKFLLSTETGEGAIKDADSEVVGAIEGFDNWYWDEEDYRQEWLPEAGGDLGELDAELVGDLGVIYDRNEKEAMEEGEPFPGGSKELVVRRLAWLVENWEKWYYQYKVSSDQEEWLERAGLNEEAYYYSDYGNVDKSPGIGDIFDETNMPFWGSFTAQ